MFCKKCGTSIKDETLFCPVCGNRVDVARDSLTDTEKIEKTALHVEEVVLACADLCKKLSGNCENVDTESRKKHIYSRLGEIFDAMAFCASKIRQVTIELKKFAETFSTEDDIYPRESYCFRMTDELRKHSADISELIALCVIEGVDLPCKKDAKTAMSEADDLCRRASGFTETTIGVIRRKIAHSSSASTFGSSAGAPEPQCCNAALIDKSNAVTIGYGVKGAPKRGIMGLFSGFRRRSKDNQPQSFTIPDIVFEENETANISAAVPAQQQNEDSNMDSFELADVQFSAIIQKEVSREEYVSLDIIMYEDDFRKIVEEKLDETVKEVKKHYYGITNNTRIKVVLTAKGAEIDNSVEEYVWRGRYLEFSFLAYVPGDYTGNQISFCATVYANDIIATRLNIVVNVNGDSAHTTELRRDDINTAFISYSSDDRIRVSSIIQGMQKMRPDLDVFMDVESLRSGEDWKVKLQNEIDKRDVLFLCWSKAAKASKWVEFEWRYALERKGEECIEPLPIDPTELCEPPEELSKKHFNDKMVYLVKALEYMSSKTPYITVCEDGISKKICVNKDEFILGRDKQETDYSICSPKVSRLHAKIIKDKERYFIIDLGSVNKTYVDGDECVPDVRTPIGNGTLLKVADQEILFELV